jgi:hypothetical protein
LAISRILACALLFSSLSGEEGGLPFMAAIPTDAPIELDWQRPVQAELYVGNPRALAESMNFKDAIVETASLKVTLGVLPTGVDPPEARDRAPSFVVDFDEPSVKALLESLRESLGASPTIEELTAFVASAITTKSYERGWDLASRTATDREGDCTEHAVLLAALARASGYPARVIVGAAILVLDGRPQTFGHAWSEIHNGETWVLADATGVEGEQRVYYIREGALADEGMGYQWSMVEAFKDLGVSRVKLSNPSID